jgi:hypothetical protein
MVVSQSLVIDMQFDDNPLPAKRQKKQFYIRVQLDYPNIRPFVYYGAARHFEQFGGFE